MNVLVIGLFTLLAVGSWVVFDVYRALVKTTVPEVLQEQIKSLDPEIEATIISDLNNRRQFSEEYLDTLTPRFLLGEGETSPEPEAILIETEPEAVPKEETATPSGEIGTVQ